MWTTRSLLAAVVVIASLLSAGPARAAVFVVDPSGAGDALDIQSAVDMASRGDVILVRSGVYPGFILDRGVTVVADTPAVRDQAIVTGVTLVTGVPGGAVAGMEGLVLEYLQVRDCPGTVVGDVIAVNPPSAPAGPGDQYAIEIVDAADVRMRQLGMNPGDGSGRHGVLVERSVFAAEGASLDGAKGTAGTAASPHGGDGGHGVVCTVGSVVRLSNFRVRGGGGGDALFSTTESWAGGDGGDAFVVDGSSLLVAKGTVETQIQGGWAGRGSLLQGGGANCPLEGAPGAGLRVEASATARVSSLITIEGGFSGCFEDGPTTVVNGELVFADPAETSLHFAGGIPQIGLPSALEIIDVPGTAVALMLGFTPVDVPLIKWKGSPLRVDPLLVLPGITIPGGGGVSIPFALPKGVPDGIPLYIQAACLRPNGDFFLSNDTHSISSPPEDLLCDPGPCNPKK